MCALATVRRYRPTLASLRSFQARAWITGNTEPVMQPKYSAFDSVAGRRWDEVRWNRWMENWITALVGQLISTWTIEEERTRTTDGHHQSCGEHPWMMLFFHWFLHLSSLFFHFFNNMYCLNHFNTYTDIQKKKDKKQPKTKACYSKVQLCRYFIKYIFQISCIVSVFW